MADTIVPFIGTKGFATGITGTSIADETGAFQGSVVTGFNGLTGAVTGVTTTFANTFTALQTFAAGITVSGATFTGQVTVKTFKADTIGGDEGGQIDFGIPLTNTSLTGGVAIDVYQNKLRFFETGGTARGAYIDLTAADSGAGRDILGVVKSFNGDTGAVKLYFPTYNEQETRSGITAQSDYSVFTDFVGNNFSSSIGQAGWLGINANGGSFTISTAAITSYGFDKCNGVINFITGTTNNTTGYAGCLLQASHIPGIPTPSNGFITKYEIECRFMTDTDVTSQDTKTRIGFADTWTNTIAADGVYFERTYDTLLPLTETTFQVVFRNGGSEERINTGVTFAASTIYRAYLSVERDSSGTFTTSWEILNDTTSVTSSGTASPTTTARYPTASTDYVNPGCIIQKTGSVTTATSRLIRVDYIGARIRRPLNRSMKLFA